MAGDRFGAGLRSSPYANCFTLTQTIARWRHRLYTQMWTIRVLAAILSPTSLLCLKFSLISSSQANAKYLLVVSYHIIWYGISTVNFSSPSQEMTDEVLKDNYYTTTRLTPESNVRGDCLFCGSPVVRDRRSIGHRLCAVNNIGTGSQRQRCTALRSDTAPRGNGWQPK